MHCFAFKHSIKLRILNGQTFNEIVWVQATTENSLNLAAEQAMKS